MIAKERPRTEGAKVLYEHSLKRLPANRCLIRLDFRLLFYLPPPTSILHFFPPHSTPRFRCKIMDEAAVALAGRAAELSTSLYRLGECCGHDETSSDISNVAGELALLSTTLWRLQEAMTANKDSYTTAFSDDLDEIISELTLLFDEIGECCVEMQKMDTLGADGWFFKKGRVSRLQKHLEALKTTLVVMRTVLHHGKEYGVQKYVYAV